MIRFLDTKTVIYPVPDGIIREDWPHYGVPGLFVTNMS